MPETISIKDFHFTGFSGIDSQCSISLLFPETKPSSVVVACTQKKDYYGTAVTTGFELILKTLINNSLNGEYGEELRKLFLEDSPEKQTLTQKLIGLVSNRKPKEKYKSLIDLFENDALIWLEIYPEKTGIIDDRITIQRVFLTEDDSPVWSNLIGKEYVENKLNVDYDEVIMHAI
ncbi:hypothetical protein VCHA40P238_50049 [Vibrio chagasii]|nr:hypothetical protein VCHA34P120_240051 [Vibrio chagasii]CAH7336720.1 hypothetical protein VCHA40P238_50049 [Vibrio chagasii]